MNLLTMHLIYQELMTNQNIKMQPSLATFLEIYQDLISEKSL